jgi:hypothetical protein
VSQPDQQNVNARQIWRASVKIVLQFDETRIISAAGLTSGAKSRMSNFSEADMAHIAEEIESMGKTEKRELVSRLTSSAVASAGVAVSTESSRS